MLLNPRSTFEHVDERRAAMLREAEAAWRWRAALSVLPPPVARDAGPARVAAARPPFRLRLGTWCIEVRVSHFERKESVLCTP